MRRAWLLLAGCDGLYAGFLNAVPVSDEGAPAEVHVILGVDGLARAAWDGARARGAFDGWSAADLVSPFPATSDYAWTRVLRTAPIPAYEVEYYDPRTRETVNGGLSGVIEHGVRGTEFPTLPCYERFDYFGNGDLFTVRLYDDPVGSLPAILDELFDAVRDRAARQSTVLAYVPNVDVIGHLRSLDAAVDALVYLGERIDQFRRRNPGRFRFTILSDHGHTHREAELVDLEDALREVGVPPVAALGDEPRLEAVAVIHTRVSYVSLHAHAAHVEEVAARLSRHRWVGAVVLAAGEGGDGRRFALWRDGERLSFAVARDGAVLADDPAAWRAGGVDVPGDGPRATLGDREAFDRTAGGRWPDLFRRVATGFAREAVDVVPDLIVSLRDEYASYGFHAPGAAARSARMGFHGNLERGGSVGVLATQTGPLPPALRADDVADLFPELVE